MARLPNALSDVVPTEIVIEKKPRKKPEFQPKFLFLRITDENGNPVTGLKLNILGGGPVLPQGVEFVRLSRQAQTPGGYEIEITRNHS